MKRRPKRDPTTASAARSAPRTTTRRRSRAPTASTGLRPPSPRDPPIFWGGDDGILEDSLKTDPNNAVTIPAGSSGDDYLKTVVITGLPTSGWSFDFAGLTQAGV